MIRRIEATLGVDLGVTFEDWNIYVGLAEKVIKKPEKD
jgi:hypothetical protein